MTINALSIIPCKTDSCPTMGGYAIKKKMNVSWANRKKGDIVLFDFNHNRTSDHIGIVEAVNKDGSITTIEGNTSKGSNTNGGQVQRRVRHKGDVNFLVRPKYTKAITADMVIATARAELGIKESPKNSNKVKYNVWFYGKNLSAFWCCTFVCWVFAHVKEPEKPFKKPTGKYAGEIAKPKLKKGSKGQQVKYLQMFLNWYFGGKKLNVDGKFGKKTEYALKLFQKYEKIGVDGVYGNNSYKHAKAYEYVPPKKTTPAKTPAKKTPAKTTAKKTETKTKPEKAVEWGLQIAKSGKYTYTKWSDKDKKTQMCPVCHPSLKGKYKGWNCIGFVTACYFHGAELKNLECSCKGLGTTGFLTKVSLNSWRKRNGKDWDMVSVGAKNGADIPASKLKAGDVLLCYDGKGKNHHVAMYIGNDKYIDCTNTSKNHIATRPYSKLCKKYHVTRAFRYTGK